MRKLTASLTRTQFAIRTVLLTQDHVKKMLERAENLNRGRISTGVIKNIFAANTDEQFAAAMKQLEGK